MLKAIQPGHDGAGTSRAVGPQSVTVPGASSEKPSAGVKRLALSVAASWPRTEYRGMTRFRLLRWEGARLGFVRCIVK